MIAPIITTSYMREFFDRAIEISDKKYRIEALIGLFPHLTEWSQKEAIIEILKPNHVDYRDKTINTLEPYLSDRLKELVNDPKSYFEDEE